MYLKARATVVTLKDVAQRAGVSTATVSRVLSGTYYVSDETKRRVLQVVELLNYQPNGIARSLRSARTHTLGVLVPDISNPYFMSLVRAFEDAVGAQSYHMILASSDDHPEKQHALLNILLEKRVDGILLAPCQSDIGALIQHCADRKIPVVLVDRKASDVRVDTVTEESEVSAYELIKYVISLGHLDIAMINSNVPISTVMERQRGYERALLEASIVPRSEYAMVGGFDQITGYTSGKRLLEMGSQRPSAIFCTNNFITTGVLLAAKELNISVPHDVSVVSFGDLWLSELISPKMTAVIQNPERVGSIAARILLNKLNTDSTYVEQVILQTHIRLGDSVTAPHSQ